MPHFFFHWRQDPLPVKRTLLTLLWHWLYCGVWNQTHNNSKVCLCTDLPLASSSENLVSLPRGGKKEPGEGGRGEGAEIDFQKTKQTLFLKLLLFVFGYLLCNTISWLCFLHILFFDTVFVIISSVLQDYDVLCFKPQVNLTIPRIWGMLASPQAQLWWIRGLTVTHTGLWFPGKQNASLRKGQ